MSFVMIYTYSMQLEVHMTSSTTNNVTLELMRKSFLHWVYQKLLSQTMPPTLQVKSLPLS